MTVNSNIKPSNLYTESQKTAMWSLGQFTIISTLLLFLQHHVAVSSPSGATTHSSPNMQKLALFQIKRSLSINACDHVICEEEGLPSYPKTMDWSMNSDCCKWNGVTCNQATGNVIGLDLSCSCLVGSIPSNSTLFQLSYLQNLNFRANDLNGILPERIFHLPNLKQLNADGNFNLTTILPKIKWGSSSSLQMLSLQETTISGGIPHSVGYLKSLTIFSLSSCKITGLIPKLIGNLTQLTELDLDFNDFSGTIPDSFANLQNLKYLSLSDNKISGQFPTWVANLTQLKLLDLSGNLLSRPLPSNLTARCLPELMLLSLSYNLFNGTIPSWLFDLPSLTRLFVDHNSFTGQLNEFKSSTLRTFTCANNLLSGSIPQSLSKLASLISLDISYNNFSGVVKTTTLNPDILDLRLASCKIIKIPHFIKSLEKLQYLDLSNNQIVGEVPQWLWKGSLSELNLSYNYINGGLQHLPENRLIFLDLQHNKLKGSLPASICNSSSLYVLNLSHNNLSGVLPACPRSSNYSLTVLDLRMNRIRGSLPSSLSNFRELKSLNLYGNEVEGTIPLSFAKFGNLEVLDLGSNRINDTFPQWLEVLPRLQVLVLKLNKFHGTINSISTIQHSFPSLRIIDLSNNEFSGPLPAKYFENFKGMMNGNANKMGSIYMGNSYYRDRVKMVIKGVDIEVLNILTVFTTIDLSKNKFEGQIPEFIGNLKSLRLLNLSHNHLSGHIPSMMGKLLMLESLDLSFNRLVGVIPQELAGIYTLSRLNLSYNDLNGHIPVGTQFQTFENDSYVGNLALCGPPLSKKCTREFIEMQDEEDEDADYFFSGFTWETVVIGYGSGVVVGFAVGYIMFRTRDPKWITRIIVKKFGLNVRRSEIRRFL